MAEALIVCRFLHFIATMILFGTSSFLCWLVPMPLRAEVERPLWRLSVVALLVGVVTAIAWLLLETGEISDSWADMLAFGTLGSVLVDTSFGQVWVWRLGIGLLLLAALVAPGAVRWPLLALLSGLFLASLGLVGHASMQAGPLGWGHRLNHAVHLLAAALWVGALVPLWVCLRRRREPAFVPGVATVLTRFSRSGRAAVALVLLTGVTDTYLVLGHPPLDFSSPYQAMLAIKIVIVGIMVLIALFNRYALVPRLEQERPDALHRLVQGTVTELILSGFVIALVSTFATFDPV